MLFGVSGLLLLLLIIIICAAHGKARKGPTKVSTEAPNFLADKGDCLLVVMTPHAREPFLTAVFIDG